jgi:tyrosyl-tRNA synthetase
VLRQERLRLREQLERRKSATSGQFPIAFDRQRRLFNGGFLDYAYQQNTSSRTSLTNSLSLLSGTEILGGDVQVNGQISKSEFESAANVVDLLSEKTNGLIFPSKGEARKMIQGGGVSINKEKVTDPNQGLSFSLLQGKYLLVQKGKKQYYIISVIA